MRCHYLFELFSMKKFTLALLLLASTLGVSAQQADSISTSGEPTSSVVLTPNQARKQRGFTSDTNFVPKGQWIFGGTASYSTHHNADYKLAIIDGIDSEGYTVKVSPMIAYAPWKNMAVGVRFGHRSCSTTDGRFQGR